MNETQSENMTTVIGYFNPQKYTIFIEISEINLKAELAPGAYIRDRQNHYINDPIFEPYCHQKGLAKATGDKLVPIVYVPRFLKSERPTTAVSQAVGFVRQSDGRTIPTYPEATKAPRLVPTNKKPVTGMTMEAARKIGLVGKPRLVSEDYGAAETTGAPLQGGNLPPMKYSVESQPRIKTAAPLRPELTEIDQTQSPEEQQKRHQLLETMSQTAETAPKIETFDPRTMRPPQPQAPATPPGTPPVQVTPQAPAKTAPKPTAKTKPPAAPPRPAPGRKVVAKKRIAKPVTPTQPTQPVQAEKVEPVEETTQQPEAQQIQPGSGVVQPLDESAESSPVLESPPTDAETGNRFICAADGRAFQFRSELERHVKRNYGDMYDELMAPYPA